MPTKNTNFITFTFAAIFLCAALILPGAASAQRRDHLNEAEVELVREAQAIDRRTEIFV